MGSPSGDWAEQQKRKWCMEQLHLPDERVHIVDPADKSLFSHPGAVLVDDWLEHRAPWEARGGIFIHYTSAKRSIALLSGVLKHLTISPQMAPSSFHTFTNPGTYQLWSDTQGTSLQT